MPGPLQSITYYRHQILGLCSIKQILVRIKASWVNQSTNFTLDEEATNLEADKAKLKDELLTLEHQLTKMQKKTPDKTDDVAAKEAEITNKKKQIAEATEVLKQYRDSKTAGNQIPGKDKTQTNGTNGTTKNKKTNGQNNKTKGADNESKGENSGHTKPKPGGIFRKRNNNGG